MNVTVNYNSSYGTVTYNSNTVSGTGITPYQNSEVTLVATPLDGYVFNGWTVTKGTESTNYSGTSLTFVATGEMSVTANFALAVVDYNMIIDNVSPSGSLTGARNSTWTYNTDNNHPAALKLQSSNGSKEVNGLSNSYNRLYAYVYDAKDTGYSSATYTLSVPDGYIITSYNLTYSVYNSYIGQVTVSNGTTTETPNDTKDHYLTANPNAQTAQFTISTSQSGQQYITIESFIVTVMKEGAGSGSTPTQYTITATANPGTAGSVTGGGTYNEGAEVTLTATPNSGFEFVNWTKGGNEVSRNANYSFTADATASYVANFQATAQTTFAVTTTASPVEGGTATFAVGTGQETTSATIASGTQVTLYAEANAGYRFVNWTKGGNVVSTNATTTNVTITEASNFVANFEIEESQDVLTTGYYHLVSRVTSEHEYLYNNALRTNNSKKYTLQSDSKITTNNGIWYITVNGSQLGVKNGDGNALVTGAAYRGDATSHNTLNIEKTTTVAGVTYYSFEVGINSTNRTQYNFTLEGSDPVKNTDNNYVTTWAGNPDAEANQWRLELVDTDGKNIYNVLVECTEQDVYVVYNEEYAFNGGFFITDATITTQQLTAKKGDAAVQGVTISVEGNTIRVVDTETFDITVNANPNEGGTVTGGGTYNEGATVTLTATPASGYHFVNWTNNLNTDIVTENPYTPTAAADVTYTATFAKNSYELTYIVEGVETTHNVVYGASLPAAPATEKTGYTFTGWDKEVPATMPAEDVTLTAQFQQNVVTPIYYNVSVIPADTNGSVQAENIGTGTVEAGTVVTFTATANDGYEFDGWYDGEDKVSDENPYTFAVNSHISYTAKFKEQAAAPNRYLISVKTTLENAPGDVQDITNGEDITAHIKVSNSAYTQNEFTEGSVVTLVAYDGNDAIHYSTRNVFIGWYDGDSLVSESKTAEVRATKTATYEARFKEGFVIQWRPINCNGSIQTENGENLNTDRLVVLPQSTLTFTASYLTPLDPEWETYQPENGYEFIGWRDYATGTLLIEDNKDMEIVYTVTEDMVIRAKVDLIRYTLTVSTDGNGTATATSNLGTGAKVEVVYNETATITAVPAVGYRFSRWTKDGNVVSTDATLTIPAYGNGNFNDVEDAEYVAYFEELEAEDAGYYRIAYDYQVPVDAVATVAAGEDTYVVTPASGGFTERSNEWSFITSAEYPAGLKINATKEQDLNATVKGIGRIDDNQIRFYGYDLETQCSSIKYTISVPDGYVITEYGFAYSLNSKSYHCDISYEDGDKVTTITSPNDISWYPFSTEVDDKSSTYFTLTNTSGIANEACNFYVKEFYVIIKNTSDDVQYETKRLYMQSEPCGVSGNENALQMAEDSTGAASIFYFDGLNLLSYTKGTYLREEDTYKGLQGVGEAGGAVQILVDGSTAVIKAPNYLHAEAENGKYFVSSDTDDSHVNEHKFVLKTVTSLPVTIGSVGYSTFYAPVAVSLPDGVKAYYLAPGNLSETMAIMTEIQSNVVPQNTPVVLGAQKGTYNLTIIDDVPEEYNNLLRGTVAATYVTDVAYVLSDGSDGIGFYRAERNQQGNTAFLNNSHKIYLSANQPSPIPQFSAGFRLFFGGTTGIEYIYGEGVEGSIYDLSGRKLEGITAPGVYIVNGQKLLVK